MLSLRDILSILRFRWLPGLASGILVAAVVAYWMMSQAPVYQASTTVMVEMHQSRILTNMEDIVDERVNNLNIAINTHFERLRSHQFATRVAEELSEAQIDQLIAPYLNPDNPDHRPSPVGYLRAAFSVSSRSDSQTLIFTGRHQNPRVAAWVADLYAHTYIRYLTSLRVGSSEVAITFLEEQVQEAREEVAVGEEALQDYRRDNNLVSIEENQEVVSQELQSLNQALNQHQITLVSLRSQIDQIKTAETSVESLSRIPALVENETIEGLIGELENLRQERDILSRKYLSRHPEMVANANRQEAIIRQLEAAADRRQATLEETENGIEAQIANLRARIGDAEERARELDRLAIQYTVREREVDSKRRTYERLIDRLNETQVTTQLDTTTLRIMDEAYPPQAPLSPSLQKTIMTAGMLFAICLVGIPVALELLDNRVRTFADIELILKKPLLGDIREVTHKGIITRSVVQDNEEVLESFRSIYSALHLKNELSNNLSLLVTSTIPSEGKSFVAANLGEVFARHGRRTVVIDSDLRRPALARYLEQSNEKGLLSWVRARREQAKGNASAEPLAPSEITRIHITEKLDLIPAGGSTKSPTEILSSEEFDVLVSYLRDQYEIIIFDTPPVGVFPDATLLTDYVDASVYVVRQKQVARAAARHGINTLDHLNAPVTGAILNGINSNPTSGRGEYGNQYGGYGYGYKYAYNYKKQYQEEYRDDAKTAPKA